MAKLIKFPKEHKIPTNWKWVKLGNYIKTKTGYPFDSKRFSKKSEGLNGLIRIRDIVRGYTETFTNEECTEDYIIHKGDMLIGMDGDFNIAKWNSSDAFLNQRVCLIKSNSKNLLNDFLFYYLPYPLESINETTPSMTVKHLSTKTLEQIPFPLPPLAEQERIVNKLDNYISKLDEAKEKLEKVVDTYNYRKNLILHRAFTGQLTKNWRKENPNIELNEDIKNKAITKDSMLPDEYLYEIPENWRWVRLGDIGEIVTGSTPNTKDKSYFGGDVLFIKPTELDQEKNIISSAETLTEKGKQISRPVRKGSTCLCCIGSTIGKCGFLTVEAVTNQQINTVVPYDFLDDLFVYYYCSSKFFKTVIRERSCATTIYIINKTKTSKLPFPLPPLEEQKEIVKILDSILSKEKQVKEIAEKEIERVEDLKKNLLTRAFGGVLGTNDPNEENSIELLKTVL